MPDGLTETGLAALLARLEHLEAENQRLSAKLDRIAQPIDPPSGATPTDQQESAQVGRRGLLKRVGAVAVGATALGAAQVAAAPAAAAADGEPMLMGRANTATGATYCSADVANHIAFYGQNYGGGRAVAIQGSSNGTGVLGTGTGRAGVIGLYPAGFTSEGSVNQAGVGGVGARGAVGVFGTSDSADAILGQGTGPAAVHGNTLNPNGIGVFGDGHQNATGVYGHSGTNDGVRGVSNSGRAVFGVSFEPSGTGVYGVAVARSGTAPASAAVTGDSRDFVGVQGISSANDGVIGRSATGRGGVFAGAAAAVRLLPGTADRAPAAGQTGDLYVDSTGSLWFCKRGGNPATWIFLA